MPKTLKVHNAINVAQDQHAGASEAVLVEKGDLSNQVAAHESDESRQNSARPPSRVAGIGQGESRQGITPRSNFSLLQALNKIYEEQDVRLTGQDFLEEPGSPEYSLMQAIDDSCLLFAVKENQSDPRIKVHSDNSSLESTQKLLTPALNRNFHDPQRWLTQIDTPEMVN